jgi:glycerol-3-phosphate O-acyltransferase
VFVPVALNYDRVLEDRILLNAKASGGRRFDAKISVIAGFFFKQIWLRLRGKYHKFGYAAVSFGRPLSLASFSEGREGEVAKPLALELMGRINSVVPVLPAPMVAAIVEAADTPLSRAAIEAAYDGWVQKLQSEHVHLPRDDLSYATEAGLRILEERGVILRRAGMFEANPERRDLLCFYANSIAHLLR